MNMFRDLCIVWVFLLCVCYMGQSEQNFIGEKNDKTKEKTYQQIKK